MGPSVVTGTVPGMAKTEGKRLHDVLMNNTTGSVDGKPIITNRGHLKETVFSIHAVVLEIQRTTEGGSGLFWVCWL